MEMGAGAGAAIGSGTPPSLPSLARFRASSSGSGMGRQAWVGQLRSGLLIGEGRTELLVIQEVLGLLAVPLCARICDASFHAALTRSCCTRVGNQYDEQCALKFWGGHSQSSHVKWA